MKTILVYSGGLDSTALLWHLKDSNGEVKCISFDYGQRHSRELSSARYLTQVLGVEHKVINLHAIRELLGGSSQTDDSVPVPEGRYDEPSMKVTVVPNRNMIMLSLAVAWAISLKFDRVCFGAHAGDHAIYPDCRPDFVDSLCDAALRADWHQVPIHAPFLHMHKKDIVAIGAQAGAPLHLSWTCYKGLEKHCGKCGSCVERREAFNLAGVEDQTIYEEAK